jgi:hypothetical protein
LTDQGYCVHGNLLHLLLPAPTNFLPGATMSFTEDLVLAKQ